MSILDLLKEAKKTEDKDKSGDSLFCCLLGPSGSGKSHTIGTTGLKTLQLYFSGEKHGIKSSKKEGGDNITPFCLDFEGEVMLSPDATLDRLRDILSDPKGLKDAGFKVVALDGLSELDLCIAQSKELKKQCLTKDGKVDGFRTSGVSKAIGNSIVKLLLLLQEKTGIHILTTCILDVQEYGDNNEVVTCAPRLSTYGFAESILQMFEDRVICGPQVKENGDRVYVFDSMTSMVRASKDDKGRVKKVLNFNPRIGSGVLPKLMKASLKELMKIKEGDIK